MPFRKHIQRFTLTELSAWRQDVWSMGAIDGKLKIYHLFNLKSKQISEIFMEQVNH